jgi:hypothetical protein
MRPHHDQPDRANDRDRHERCEDPDGAPPVGPFLSIPLGIVVEILGFGLVAGAVRQLLRAHRRRREQLCLRRLGLGRSLSFVSDHGRQTYGMYSGQYDAAAVFTMNDTSLSPMPLCS